ncbi:MAG: CHASE2 domain-containing protein, partial [Oligoflexia bacterium]
IQPDPDGVVRRAVAVRLVGNSLQKPLAFAMAEAGTGKKFIAQLDTQQKLSELKLGSQGQLLPITPTSALTINFRGPRRSFPYISALDVLKEGNTTAETEINYKLTTVNLSEIFKDAYVLIGLSAVGAFDMRAFPFDSNVPGVEGHANILDNLLSNDFLSYGKLGRARYSMILFALLVIGGILFAFTIERLESIPALALGITTLAGMGWVDLKLLFAKDIHWDFSFLYVQLSAIFITTNAVKYVLEERNKKFIKGAFSKYVSPAIVDSILKDPSKLTVGGERRDLTILFSDIRGFTTFSEKMDPKALASFLNDYLGIMTDVVFDTEGTLDKYIGDAVMAFWGAPLDQPKHAANACRAARVMLQKLAENHERFRTQYGVEVAIGIGINSGLVNVGNMGSERIFEYTVIGDHVNLASRLEGLTKYYGAGIVTTRFTFDLIEKGGEPLPAHRTLDFVKVKGKKSAVELIQVFERDFDAEGLKLFESARAAYSQQSWDQAIELFRKANQKLSYLGTDDGPCMMYIERCEELKTTGVEPNWDGAWKMTSK